MNALYSFDLPVSVGEKLKALGGESATSQTGTMAFRSVLDATGDERKSIMFAALPLMDGEMHPVEMNLGC